MKVPYPHADPEGLPRQLMRAVRVIRTNYGLLWQHLDASKVLPKLVDKSVISEAKKKEVESYHQNLGQSALIINALFTASHSLEGLLTICNTLLTTPGKEHIAQQILRGKVHRLNFPSFSCCILAAANHLSHLTISCLAVADCCKVETSALHLCCLMVLYYMPLKAAQ